MNMPLEQNDTGVEKQAGEGWERANAHLAEETQPKSVTQVPVTPVESAKDVTAVPSVIRTKQKNGPSWHFWWLLFILLILGVGAAIAFQIWDTGLIREETFQSSTTLHNRVDSAITGGQTRLEDRAQNLEARLYQLSEKINGLQMQNAQLGARLDNVNSMCQTSCRTIEK